MIKNIDCIEGLKELDDNSVDLIITDPPYNIGVDYGKYKDKRVDYYDWCEKWIKECYRVLKEKGSLYLIHYPEQASKIYVRAESKTPFHLKRWITWHYPTNIGTSKRNWTRSQRAILFFSKGPIYKFNLKNEEVLDFIEINLVKNTSKEKVKGFPNQIPEKLISLLIELSSDEGDLVCDLFSGSGTTAKVCKDMNRNFIGFEINPDFVELANRRIN